MTPESLVVVRSYSQPHEAHLARSVLEAAGIEAQIRDEHIVAAYWFFSNVVGGVKVLVRASDADAARSVLDTPALVLDNVAETVAMVDTQTDAKRFFVDKVLHQARIESVPLSAAERHMLSWSESDPDFEPDLALASQLNEEMSDEDYEPKVRGLLQRAFAADVTLDRTATEKWQQARAILKEGDHYIQIMLDDALGSKLKKWWEFWR